MRLSYANDHGNNDTDDDANNDRHHYPNHHADHHCHHHADYDADHHYDNASDLPACGDGRPLHYPVRHAAAERHRIRHAEQDAGQLFVGVPAACQRK